MNRPLIALFAVILTALVSSHAVAQPAGPDLVVYDDAILSPWMDASWDATVRFESTSHVFSGAYSIRVVTTSATGALSLRHGNQGSAGISSYPYETLSLAVYAQGSEMSLSVFFENDQGQAFPHVNRVVDGNLWAVVSIPMSELNPNNLTVHRFALQQGSDKRRTFYVDDIRFKGKPIPFPPALVFPPNGATDIVTAPVLAWNQSAGADSYHLQVSAAPDFASTVVDQNNIVDTSYGVSGLAQGTTYYWRVNSSNGGGASEWSGLWSFTTIEPPPATPNLVSPLNGAGGISTNPLLVWNTSVGGETYRLQVSTVPDFSSMLIDQTNILDTSYAASGLLQGTTYYWRVNSSNGGGASDWSSVWSFATAPAIPNLASPANGAGEVSTSPTLVWQSAPGAATYRLQVAADSTFGTTVTDLAGIADTVFAMNGLSYRTTYYWRVNASYQNGSSDWSTVWSFTTQSRWVTQVSGTSAFLSGVSFVDSNTGTVVGSGLEGGVIIRTTDGGNTWIDQVPPSTNVLHAVSFTDVGTGTVVGDWGVIVRTTDGGQIWTAQPSGTQASLLGVAFTDANTGTAVGDAILHTSNGGASWTAQASGTSHILYGVDFVDAEIGWVVGGTIAVPHYNAYLVILHTTDGGMTWVKQKEEAGGWLNAVSFADANIGTAVGGTGVILRTTNSGITWEWQSSGVSTQLNGVSFVNKFTGTVVGDYGIILQTTNGGLTWTNETVGTSYHLRGVSGVMSGNEVVWTVVGSEGTIHRGTTILEPPPTVPTLASPTNGSQGVAITPTLTWNPSERVVAYELQASLDSTFSSVVVQDYRYGQTAYDLGGQANSSTVFWRVRAANSGGNSEWSETWSFTIQPPQSGWISQLSGTSQDLYAVFSIDADTAIAVGESVILRTNDAGTTWNKTSIKDWLAGITFIDLYTGIAVGGANTILRTTDCGITWAQQTITDQAYVSFVDVDFADARHGTAVGLYANPVGIMHTTDGGITWSVPSVDMFYYSELRGVSFGDSVTGVAVHWPDFILRTTDAGSTWTQIPDSLPTFLVKVDLQDDNTGVGLGNGVLTTEDGGLTWTRLSVPSELGLGELSMFDGNTGVALGNPGIIVYTNDRFANWAVQSSGTSERLWGVSLASATTGFAVGERGVILRTTTGGAAPGGSEPGTAPATRLQTTLKLPTSFDMLQNYPNPFNPSTIIRYELPEPTRVKLQVFNILGQLVSTLEDQLRPAGYHHVTFDASSLPSGVYVYRLTGQPLSENRQSFLIVRKMILAR